MLRVIREIQPTWVVGENVRGLINWNGGLVFDEVQADLEAIGYEVTPFILPACAVNAPHRRDRVWFVAYSEDYGRKRESWRRENGSERRILSGEQFERSEPFGSCEAPTDTHNNGSHGSENGQGDSKGNDNNQTRQNPIIKPSGCCGKATREITSNSNSYGHGRETGFGSDTSPKGKSQSKGNKRERIRNATSGTEQEGNVANSKCIGQSGPGQHERPINSEKNKNGEANWPDSNYEISDFRGFPTQSPVCIGNDGLPAELDGITVSNWIKESIKAHGNAIVPQVAYQIFKVIEQMNKLNK